MKEVEEQFFEVMERIEWLPTHATFQMSANKNWGRHSYWSEHEKDRRNIFEEVYKAWGLIPIFENIYYCYFGTEKGEREFNLTKKIKHG